MMKSFRLSSTVFSLICLTLITIQLAIAQQKREITVDWIYSKEANEATALPSYAWLADGTAILYDNREKSFERLNPQTGKRASALDALRAMTSLRALLNKNEVPESLPWPIAFNS